MSSKRRKELTEQELEKLWYGVYDPAKTDQINRRNFARAIEFESRERCAQICIEIYYRSMDEWRKDNHRYNLGYAHGADECLYAFTGRTFYGENDK